MEKVKINVCVKPYYHDVIETIERKPKFNITKNKHFVRYKNKTYPLAKSSDNYIIWVENK